MNSSVAVYDQNMDLFIKVQNTPTTQRAYRWALQTWFNWLGSRPVDTHAVAEYRDWLTASLKPRSAGQAYSVARLFYRFQQVTPNPFDIIKAPKRISNQTPVVPGDEAIDEMLDLVDNSRDRLIILLLLNGLRASEVGNLQRDNIVWVPEYGRDVMAVVGKGNKERLVPASRNVSVALRKWDEEHGLTKFLFADCPLTLRAVEYAVERWSRRVGNEFRPHKLRHHYATRLARAGVNPFVLKDLLGHENIATTMVYVRMNLSDAVAEVGKDPRDLVVVEG